jgi:hypothetical protein
VGGLVHTPGHNGDVESNGLVARGKGKERQARQLEDERRDLARRELEKEVGMQGQWATYVDRTESSTVSSRHVLVKGLDGSSSGELSVLLVHVVGTGSRVVSDPDTEVLGLEGLLLRDLE